MVRLTTVVATTRSVCEYGSTKLGVTLAGGGKALTFEGSTMIPSISMMKNAVVNHSPQIEWKRPVELHLATAKVERLSPGVPYTRALKTDRKEAQRRKSE